VVRAPDRTTLFDGEGNRDGSGDGVRSFLRRFPGEDGRDPREREGVVGSTGIAGGSVLGGFVGLRLVCMGVFRFEANGWRGLLGVTISTASMIILDLTGVVGLDGTARGAGSSFSSVSSSTTVGTFFVVRDRVDLVVDFEGPALVAPVVVRVDVLEGGLVVAGGLVGGGFVEGFLDGGFTRTTRSSTSAGRTPGGLPRRLGATTGSTSIASSISVTVAFFAARFGGAFTVLDGPAIGLDRVAGCFLAGSGSSKALDSGSVFAARRVVRMVVRDLGGGFAGVTGPSDRSLRREGSDGRGSAGAFRLGAILVVRIRQQKGSFAIDLLVIWSVPAGPSRNRMGSHSEI